MKITKRRWNTLPAVCTYRQKDCGKLVTVYGPRDDYTDRLFQQSSLKTAFDVSMRGRLLRVNQTGYNPKADQAVTGLILALLDNGDLRNAIARLRKTGIAHQVAEDKIRDTLSGIGKSFAAHTGHMTLGKSILILMTSKADTDCREAITALQEIQQALQEEKSMRVKRVRYSITENKMPLLVEGNCVRGNTARASWLLDLLDTGKGDGSCYPALDSVESIAGIEELSNRLKESYKGQEKYPRNIARAVDDALDVHCRKKWQECSLEHPDQLVNLKYYFQELHAYFQEHFPIRTKTEGARKRQEHLIVQDDVNRLLMPMHIKAAVRRALIGKSTQIHIMYGKLMEYCTGSGAWDVNSDTFQKIQVIEAVKKQVMTALSCSIARLTYICDESEHDTDILLKKNILRCLEDPSKVASMRAKLPAYFPTDKETTDDPSTLLHSCYNCIRELRIQIFHYNKQNLTDVFMTAAETALVDDESCSLLQRLYQKDRDCLAIVFQEQIRSMNLRLYYSSGLLTYMFGGDQDRFTLYSDPFQMTPSFRRVYKRGSDLVPYNPKLRWFLQDEPIVMDADAFRAMRNLLQLVYYHLFLPSVQKNDAWIKDQIQAVLSRNEELAKASSNTKAVAYDEIKHFYQPTMPLGKLIEHLQLQISQTEQTSREEAQEKKDYAQRFLLDIYAAAFNHYLDVHFDTLYADVMNPVKREDAPEAFELTGIQTTLPVKLPINLLVLYPVLRLLDGQDLSDFQQQMLRYRASLGRSVAPNDEILSPEPIKLIEELIELVKTTEPLQVDAKEALQSLPTDIAPFILGSPLDYEDFYEQSDERTPVLRRNLMRMQRTGVLEVFQGKLPIIATTLQYNIIKAGQWRIKDANMFITIIEYCHRELQRMHQIYEKTHRLEEYAQYRNVALYVHRYNEAMRNMTFASLYEINRIFMEMISRWIGFTQDWERDMYFLLKAWARQRKIDLACDAVDMIFTEGKVRQKLLEELKGLSLDAFLSIYGNYADKQLDFIRVRNDSAHLALLRKIGWNNRYTNTEVGVVENYINRLRKLLYYDSKRMNAVTTAMQKILLQHKLILQFAIERGGAPIIKKVQSDGIEHLKNITGAKPISIPSHCQAFDDALIALLKYHL